MCGILGLVGEEGEFARARVLRARDLMRHRGPDDAGMLVCDRVNLGFRRLAILDLSPAGHQPMSTADGRLHLVFNGEIYNFRELRRELEPLHPFQSRTDSEVLLHGMEAWGWEGLLNRIDGMFAFAIWDSFDHRLYAARDRTGKKPFFYAQSRGKLAFASTLNALLALLDSTPSIHPRALDAYLTYQAVPAPMTLFTGVHQLPPAHALVFEESTGALAVKRYWRLRYGPKRVRGEAEALDDLDQLLRAAVKRRLASDVPLGAFLSGGVDSGLVVSLLAQEAGGAEAVVIGFRDPAFDERPYARTVARRWQVNLHEVELEADAAEELPEIVWHYGQPVADVSIVPTFAVARAAKEFVTVVLNGDGGDEAFGGYARPVVSRAAGPYRRWLPPAIRGALARALKDSFQGRLRRLAMLATAGQTPAVAGFTYYRAFRNHREIAYTPEFLRAIGGWHPDELYAAAWMDADGTDDADRALSGDFTTYLPDQLLTKMDVSTMAHSVEARSPLLDTAVLEYSAALPTALRLKGYTTKYLLKRLAERYVPREVIYRRKRGFVMPASHWLRGGLARPLTRALTSREFQRREWIRPEFVSRMLAEHGTGARDWGEQLWTLLILELWARLVLDRTLTRSDPLEAVC